MITKHSGSSAAMRWNTNILVSTYAGDNNNAYGNQFFQNLKDSCKSAGNPITLAPALVSYAQSAQTDATKSAAKMISDYPSVDGYFNCKCSRNTLCEHWLTNLQGKHGLSWTRT